MDRFFECVLFLAGLVFGSFLNVCISRIPGDESIVAPPSHCRGCGKPIRWRDNLPLLSWLLLRGRCRDCGARISARYPAVELLTGVLFAACYAIYGPSWLTLKFCVFTFLLIGLIFMDGETGLLPREFTYPGIVLGIVFSWLAPGDYSATRFILLLFHRRVHGVHWLSLMDSLLGALIGAGFFYLAWALYYLARKRHGLGFGDIALMAMSGAFLGVKLVSFVIFCSPLVGVLWVFALLVLEAVRPRSARGATTEESPRAEGQETRSEAARDNLHAASGSTDQPFLQRAIPFGVVLGACSLSAVFIGEAAWRWYLAHFLG